jgi:predicted esterase
MACGIGATGQGPADEALPDRTSDQADEGSPADAPSAPAPGGPSTSTPTLAPADDPGPAPAGCTLNKDSDGFFQRSTAKTTYVGYVPKGYDGKPKRLLVGLHGCGDSAWNFATWGVNPSETRDDQEYIGISVDGASGGGNCWSQSDAAKVLAAIDDVSQCLYVHQKKVVVAGFSSGGALAYNVGLANAQRFAGILVLNASLSWTGKADALLAGAAWNLNVAHRAHTWDSVAPLSTVRTDWSKLKSAGFPTETSEEPGGHDGTSDDWANWLIPQMATWQAP